MCTELVVLPLYSPLLCVVFLQLRMTTDPSRSYRTQKSLPSSTLHIQHPLRLRSHQLSSKSFSDLNRPTQDSPQSQVLPDSPVHFPTKGSYRATSPV